MSLSQKSLINNNALNRINTTMHSRQIAELIAEGFGEMSPHYGNVALNLVNAVGKERAVEWAAEVRRRVVEEGETKHTPGGLLLRMAKDRLPSWQKRRVFARKGNNNDPRHRSVTLLTYDRLAREAKQDAEDEKEARAASLRQQIAAAEDELMRLLNIKETVTGDDTIDHVLLDGQVERRKRELHDKSAACVSLQMGGSRKPMGGYGRGRPTI